MEFAQQALEDQTLRDLAPGAQLRVKTLRADLDCGQRLEAGQFLAMDLAYGPHGGFATGDELARRLRPHVDHPLSRLAKWIVARDIICVRWNGQMLVPLFQFDLTEMTVRRDATKIVRELTDTFDEWELALWFSQPNTWLDDRAPVDAFVDAPAAVLDAARADRFIARG